MSDDTYLTVKEKSEGLYKDKGSKFIACCYPVSCENEIKDIIKSLKKEHHSARHHCWAYRLGANGEDYRANDDGEPSNSAGKPILGQLLSYNVSNVLIVVVRYFGGTLLGVGGLIQAYKESARDALDNAEITEAVVEDVLEIEFEYPDMNNIMKIVKDNRLEILSQDFALSCKIGIRVRQSLTENIVHLIHKIDSAKLLNDNTG